MKAEFHSIPLFEFSRIITEKNKTEVFMMILKKLVKMLRVKSNSNSYRNSYIFVGY